MSQVLSQYRLPVDVKPTHYDIAIKTDLEKLTFEGIASVNLDIKNETSEIVFNAFDINLGQVTLSSDAFQDGPIKAKSVELTPKTERATAQFSTPLPANTKAQLGIRFGGKLTGSMLGYYYSSYQEEGIKKHYTLTQFEPTTARRAFPCWDEPLLKATFTITLLSRLNTVNLSNMPVEAETPYEPNSPSSKGFTDLFETTLSSSDVKDSVDTTVFNQWKITKFQVTPPVSTYLVAFANGPFKYLESSYVSPLSGKLRPLRIYATEDLIHQAQWGLDVKAKVLPVYEKLFDIEFPLPKLDTLVVHDFDAGAMENWGLITGRTTAYLLDPAKPNFASRKRIASVQSHEVAHQWFGNIVTMKWWDNLWLNEGFATIMGEMIVLHKIQPDWNLYPEFCNDKLHEALELDAKHSSHPIEVPLDNPDDINQVFDSLSYAKAGSVLRMLSEYVGEENFLKGTSIYLKKRLYGSSVTTDLWDGISEATGIDIPGLMNDWILKIGYPVLTVSETPNGIIVRQDRFLEAGKPKPDENQTIWQVPLFLTITDASGRPAVDRTQVLKERETSINVDVSKSYLIKGGNRGVYRVNYPPDRIAKIAEDASKPGSIVTLEDRMGLVNDAAALARASLAKTSSALSLIRGFSWEPNYLGCLEMAQTIANISNVFWENTYIREGLKDFRKSLFVPHVAQLGYENQPSDSPDTIQLRALAVNLAAATGESSVVEELNRRFDLFIKTNDASHIPADLTAATYRNAVKTGGIKEWETVLEIFQNAPSPSIKSAAIRGLCASGDPGLIERTLDFTRTDVQDQDLVSFFMMLSGNIFSRRRLAEYTMENWDSIDKRFELNFTQLQRLVKEAFTLLSLEKDAATIEQFFKTKNTSKFTMSLAQVLEDIRSKAKWAANSKSDVEGWLQENGFSARASL